MPIVIDDSTGNIFAGGGNSDGDLVLQAHDGTNRVHLDAGGGNARLGGHGRDGDVVLFPASGDNVSVDQATIHLNGGGGNIVAGGNVTDGDLVLRASDGSDRIRLDAGGGNAWLGGHGQDGDVVLFPATGDNASLDQATIHLNGGSGDIILSNALKVHDECSIRRDRDRGPLRGLAHGDAARPQGLPGAAGGPGELSQRHALLSLPPPAGRRIPPALGPSARGRPLRLPA